MGLFPSLSPRDVDDSEPDGEVSELWTFLQGKDCHSKMLFHLLCFYRDRPDLSHSCPFHYGGLPTSGTGKGTLWFTRYSEAIRLSIEGIDGLPPLPPLPYFGCSYGRTRVYEGEFVNFIPEGRGRQFEPFTKEELYYGWWKEGCRHGLGKIVGSWCESDRYCEFDMHQQRGEPEPVTFPEGRNLTTQLKKISGILFDLDIGVLDEGVDGVKRIGEGGQGSLFKIRIQLDSDSDFEDFAFKKLPHPSFLYGPTVVERKMRKEMALLFRAQPHRNIVKGVGFSTKPLGIVTELLWKDVHDLLISEHRMTFTQRLLIVGEVALGVRHLHRRHILHRDLKWANVMLTKPLSNPDWRAVLIDFGISEFCESFRITEKVGSRWIGTPGLIPPETLQKGIYTYKSDSYAFGLMLTEIFPDGLRNPSKHWLKALMESCLSDLPEHRPSFLEITNILCDNIHV